MAGFKQGYALIVGIASYRTVRKLPASVRQDVLSLSQMLKDAAYCGYPPEQVRVLIDDTATAAKIREDFRWLAERTGKSDTAVFYFSGHGARIVEGPAQGSYLLPYEAAFSDWGNTTLSESELGDLFREVNAGRLLAVFDCCHAGGLGDLSAWKTADLTSLEIKSGLDETLYERLRQGQGRVVIASSRSDEISLAPKDMDNSLFTHFLLKALKGEAGSNGDGLIRIIDVFGYVEKQVIVRNPNQHPVLSADQTSNFPIALFGGGEKEMTKMEANSVAPDERPSQVSRRRKIRVKIDGMDSGAVNAAGRNIIDSDTTVFPEGRSGSLSELPDLDLDLKNIRGGSIRIAGQDIARVQVIADPLDELVGLLLACATSKEEQQDIQQTAEILLREASKPAEQQDRRMLGRMSERLTEYVDELCGGSAQALVLLQKLEGFG